MIHKLDYSRFLAAAFVGLVLGNGSPCLGGFVMFEGFGPGAFFGDNNPGNGLEVATSDGFAFTRGQGQGTPAPLQRSGSSVHSWGRYRARSRNAVPCRPA